MKTLRISWNLELYSMKRKQDCVGWLTCAILRPNTKDRMFPGLVNLLLFHWRSWLVALTSSQLHASVHCISVCSTYLPFNSDSFSEWKWTPSLMTICSEFYLLLVRLSTTPLPYWKVKEMPKRVGSDGLDGASLWGGLTDGLGTVKEPISRCRRQSTPTCRRAQPRGARGFCSRRT